jgi:sensor histidine kinase YesM
MQEKDLSDTKKAISMRTKILISCISCTLLALIVQTTLFQRSSSRIILGQAQEISRSTLNNLQEDLYNFNKSIENSLIKIYNQNKFIRDLSVGNTLETLKDEHSQIAYDLAHSAFSTSQNLTSLYVYTLTHQLISVYHHAQTPIYSYPDDIYNGMEDYNADIIRYYIPSNDRVMLISNYYNSNRETNLIRYVLKIYRNNFVCVGYLVCDVDPKPFLRLMKKYRYSDQQTIWLQPTGDQVALFLDDLTDKDYPKDDSRNRQKEYERISTSIAEQTWTGGDISFEKEYVLFCSQEYKYNFNAYSLMPRSILEMGQAVLMQNTFFVLFLTLAGFSLLFLVISNGLTKPLRYMVQTMNRIRHGETNLRLKPMTKNEIGVLGQEFNDLLDETVRLIKKELQSKIAADDARYKALQAQVNPHFLYNTLDTMGGIATLQNCPTVGTLCKALSNIFRYSLNMKDTFATLEDEILHIKSYMYVMNVRMNDSIRLDYQIDSTLFHIKIPRLSIQPLVENAIQHGLKNTRIEKKIQIGAERKEQTLLIWVWDNGVGMDADTMNRHLRTLESDALQKGSSIGIDNINARIRLLYGEAYGVHVESAIGEGSRVSISMPIDEKVSEDE